MKKPFNLIKGPDITASGKSHKPVQLEAYHDFRRADGTTKAVTTVVNRNAFPMDFDITPFSPTELIRAHKFKALNLALNCTHLNEFTHGLLLVP